MRFLWLIVVASMMACGSSDGSNASAEPKKSAQQSPGSSGSKPNAQGGSVKPSSITWTAPESFQLVHSPSSMRLATYKIAHAEGDTDDAELTVTQVGGGAQANIERWKGQLKDNKERESSDTTVGDFKVTIIWLEGTFAGMAMGPGASPEPKNDYALLGAVVEWAGHGDPHFFKLVGPKKTVEAARPAFDELVQSLTPKG